MKENLNVNKYTKADGTIDFDLLYTDGMPEKTVNAIKSIEKEGKSDGIIRDAERLRTYDNRKIKENYVLTQVEDDRINEEELLLKEMKKEQHRKDMEETKEYYKKHPIKTRDIEERQTLDEFIKENPFFDSSLIHIKSDRALETYGQTHTINVYYKTSRYGKSYPVITANTKQVDTMRQLKVVNFGSIQDFLIDTLPKTLFRAKGTEKIVMQEGEKQDQQGTYMISRRFISKTIKFWANMTGIRYVVTSDERRDINALSLWGKDLIFYGFDDRKMAQYFSNGEDCIKIIKDILFVMRDKEYNPNKVSDQLNRIIQNRCKALKIKPEKVLKEMKDNIYYTYQCNDVVWSFPKVSVEYLFGLLKELKSGRYDITLMIPLIYDMRTYPIKCTDMHIKPMTEEEHKINKDEYDIGRYIFERHDGVDRD